MSTNVSGLRFVVRHPGGQSDLLTIDSDHVLIGSGAHCEVRLPSEQSAVEHVEVVMAPGGMVTAQARTLDRLPTINGVAFEQSSIHEGDVLGVGAVQIQITVVEIEDNPNVIKKKTQRTSAMTYVLALLAIPLAAYVLLMEDEERPGAKIPKEFPELWGPQVTVCPQAAPDQAGAFALERRVLADGRRERRPFHVQDGVAAVPLYEVAAACFKVAGDPSEAAEAGSSAEDLRRKVGEDYRAHRMRLEHALGVNDFVTAQREVRVLRAFTEGRSGPYVVWLGNLERQLQLKLGDKRT
jgi:hypothetical protein